MNKLREEPSKAGLTAPAAVSGDQTFLLLQLKAKIEATEHCVEMIQKELQTTQDGVQNLDASMRELAGTTD